MGNKTETTKKIVIIGGCGHVGLPLGVKCALAGFKTLLVDVNEDAVKAVNNGRFPFLEQGGNAQLAEALHLGLEATTDVRKCATACSTGVAAGLTGVDADVFVFVVGTPVDEHLNPKISGLTKIFQHYQEYFKPGALVIMRSTLFPGTMTHLHKRIEELGRGIKLAFCPERVSQGYALKEIDSLAQVISAFDDESFQAAYEVFAEIAPTIIRLEPLEAELSKLMANSWRYLEFAIANQFYMIAEQNNVDFYRIYKAICYNYPRASGYKSPGFAAGPCLFKDTMQLASYFNNQFYLGHSAMLVNEGLCAIVVDKATKKVGGSLWEKTVGLLGMTFKADNDDIRDSLSFKVKKALEFNGAKILYHDPYLAESSSLEDVLKKSDVIVLATPHGEYRDLRLEKPIVDIWGFYNGAEIEILPGNRQ